MEKSFARRSRKRRKHFRVPLLAMAVLGIVVVFGGLVGLVIYAQAHTVSAPEQTRGVQRATTQQEPLRAGMLAPDFQLPSVQGETYHFLGQARVRLLTFLQTQPDTEAGLSRGQVVSLISIQHQYRSKGVDVVAIDASALETGHTPDHDSLVNVLSDWHLGMLPLLMDDAANTTALHYGVQHAPVTFLISADGRIIQTWNGLAQGAQLALALQPLVDPPMLSTPAA